MMGIEVDGSRIVLSESDALLLGEDLRSAPAAPSDWRSTLREKWEAGVPATKIARQAGVLGTALIHKEARKQGLPPRLEQTAKVLEARAMAREALGAKRAATKQAKEAADG